MTLTLHPWCSGQPHRIKALEDVLAHIAGHEGVWSATGAEFYRCFRRNQNDFISRLYLRSLGNSGDVLEGYADAWVNTHAIFLQG